MSWLLQTKMIIIRLSHLPGWADCARREAARIMPDMITGAGFTLRTLVQGVGAAVGTAVHKAAAYTLTEKLEDRGLGDDNDAEDLAIDSFNTQIGGGVMWDDTTKIKGDGHRQIQRMVRSYRKKVAPTINPVSVEERLKANLVEGMEVSGQRDVLGREPHAIIDLKTGKSPRANSAQYGGYAMLHHTHEPDNRVERITEHHLPRVGANKDQPEPITIQYDVQASEWLARDLLDDIVRSVDEFKQRVTAFSGKPPEGAFRANPYSMLCSEKFCPAWGTDFCRVHRRK